MRVETIISKLERTMKIKALIAAAVLATVSTAAVADVTTSTGELVIVEKNQVGLGLALLPIGIVVVAAVASSSSPAGGS